MDQKVYEITFVEKDVINNKIKIKSDSKVHALQLFYLEHPNADYTDIVEVQE